MIYLDHAATTPIHPEVVEAMLPYLREHFGNPSSIHAYGQKARLALSGARDTIAARLNCPAGQLIFTSGGTESDNLALFGVASSARGQACRHIVTSAVEHHAVLHACRQLERLGFEVTELPVDETGRIDPEQLEAVLRPDTLMISLMFGNNEVGTLQPIEEVGQIARAKGVPLHVDAVQALGAEPLSLAALPVDLASFSAHKINGPKGVGALYVSKGVPLTPGLFGGSQERNKRAGTENVAGIVGFAKAVDIAVGETQTKRDGLRRLRARMIARFGELLGPERFVVNGHPTEHLPHILNVSFPGVDTETMLMNLDLAGIAAASGSACSSGSLEPSHVLKAMGLPGPILGSAVRFSFGFGTTEKEIDTAAQAVATILLRYT